jgi:hypothetical protein
MTNKRGSTKEVLLSGSTVLAAGAMFVNADSNSVVVNPVSQTAAAFAAAIGASGIKSVDLAARTGQFADTGFAIFDV